MSLCINCLGEATLYVVDEGNHLSPPYTNAASVAHSPPYPLLNQVLSRHDATPSKRRVITKGSLNELTLWKISRLEDLIHQGILVGL